MKHAERLGTELVLETAEEYLNEAQMIRLRIVLDRIERNKKSAAGFSVGKKRRRSQDETKAAVLALHGEGKIPAAIADDLGVSDEYVERILRAA